MIGNSASLWLFPPRAMFPRISELETRWLVTRRAPGYDGNLIVSDLREANGIMYKLPIYNLNVAGYFQANRITPFFVPCLHAAPAYCVTSSRCLTTPNDFGSERQRVALGSNISGIGISSRSKGDQIDTYSDTHRILPMPSLCHDVTSKIQSCKRD